ncbi:MAG: oxidoreductase molybdopterin binding [Acidimicrobiia bacterium]|nr:oxidoreductase molybdopterin binding [Acidimicrobiia bacterium]
MTVPDSDADVAAGAPIGRRVVLASLGLGALGIVVGSKAQHALSQLLLPVTLHDPTGLTDLLPVAGRFRIYSVTNNLPHRSIPEYRLRVDGMVQRPLDLTYDDLHQRLPQVSLRRDFQCVTGWRVESVPWVGVALHRVLDEAGVLPAATRVRFHSFDGTYTESLSLDQARRDDVLVAHTLEGHSLSREHGGPVRLYVAPMFGYKSLKWLERIELVDHVVDHGGYWEGRGYDLDGWVGRSNGGHEEPITP